MQQQKMTINALNTSVVAASTPCAGDQHADELHALHAREASPAGERQQHPLLHPARRQRRHAGLSRLSQRRDVTAGKLLKIAASLLHGIEES